MGFAYPCGADEEEICGFREPLGVKELHDFSLGDLGVKGPIEIDEALDALDARGAQEELDAFFLSEAHFLGEKRLEKGFMLLREGVGIGEKLEVFPQIREAHRSHGVISLHK